MFDWLWFFPVLFVMSSFNHTLKMTLDYVDKLNDYNIMECDSKIMNVSLSEIKLVLKIWKVE